MAQSWRPWSNGSRPAGIGADLRICPTIDKHLPVDLATALYRIVEEGLARAARNPAVHRVGVTLQFEDAFVQLEISTDAPHVDAEAARDTSLALMRERVEHLGGCLDADPIWGSSTSIKAIVPLFGRVT